MDTMTYKNYTGSIEYSEADSLFYGKLLGIRSLIPYEGKTKEELVEGFHETVDDYLDICSSEGFEPEEPAVER